MKYKYPILILFCFVMAMPSCKDSLEDLNMNPNQPEEITPDVLLTTAMRDAMNSMVNESFLLGNNAAQLTAKTLRAEVDIYAWNAFPTVWQEMYRALANVSEAERLSVADGNANMEAVAVVLRTWMFSILTDAYGDVPYTEAIKGGTEGIFLPRYDEQQEIYNGTEGLLAELRRANTLFNDTEEITGDIIFSGDAAKWRKLCNSLRLRLLMRASNKLSVATEFSQIVAGQPLMESNADNAELTYLGSFPNEFPLIPLKTGDFEAVVMSGSAIDVMMQYGDPRLMTYARPDNLDFENPTFSGAVNGSENPDICSKAGSRLGLAYYDFPGHPTSATHANGILMTYAELQFLLAEAAVKGMITADPADHYRTGIQASMDYHQVDYSPIGYADFDDYYQSSGVEYNAAGVGKIWEQKWLALFFTGLEPYFELRRWIDEAGWAGVPFVSPTCDNLNDDQLPVRFIYPGEEQSLNNANYQEAVGRLGSDSQNARMWLLQ